MAEFQCIVCGGIKESDISCSCPICGCKMFEVPYNKRDVLVSEIKNYIAHLQVKTAKKGDFIFEGQTKDAARFPDYDKILKYVSGRDRTEDFLRNLLETAEQMKLHFSSQFSNTYPVSFERLNAILRLQDEALYKAARILCPEFNAKLPPAAWEKVSVLYTETPDPKLLDITDILLEQIGKLTKKIERFIKINNLYGSVHKYHPKKRCDKLSPKTDYRKKLEDAAAEAEKVLEKRYIVDITDDGSDELMEMLTCLWHSIELIMKAPLLIGSFVYRTASGDIGEAELLARLGNILENRYAGFDLALNAEQLLADKTEEELLALYKELIGVDRSDYFGPAGTELVNVGESEKKLGELIGLKGIKESIRKIKAYALMNKDSEELNIHMCFLGNPGSGKTEVARYIAGILYENKILPTKNVVEVDRSGLVSQYFGATAEKTSGVIKQAMGGVLFIDEAYALGNNSDAGITDYGKEAIDTLVKAMEDNRGKFCVILAGYKNEMLQMLSVNPGFKSRIQFMLDFPNYSREELKSITELMLSSRHYTIGEAAMSRLLDITDIKRKDPNFANAREIRNILDQVIMCQNLRVAGPEDKELGLVDVDKYIKDAKINLPTAGGDIRDRVLTGEEELDQLIGLDAVKRMIRKIKAYAKRNKGEDGFNLHMCFYGNPGTGKTEVARILSRILYDAGVLEESKLVETDGRGLVGKYVGETAPRTKAKINEAMSGVLFIDEAYSLIGTAASNSASSGYGEEAIAVLLKEMEDKRGQFCAILAGYKEEMEKMLASNPGFQSRIQFTLDFPDYTREELGEIATSFLRKKKYEIDDPALELLLDVAEYYRNRPNFANARTIRNILDQVIMNQNLRTEDAPETMIRIEDVRDYIADERIDLNEKYSSGRKIGF